MTVVRPPKSSVGRCRPLKLRFLYLKGIPDTKVTGGCLFLCFLAVAARKSMKNSRIAQMLVDKLSENNYNGYSEFRVNIFLRLL